MSAIRPLYRDPFAPVLFSSPPLAVSDEQKSIIRRILDLSASDSRFAQKAYDAIQFVLTSGNTVLPVISNLSPPNASIGSPSFTLRVLGTGFDPSSIIIWNGSPEPTTFISATELNTIVDMSTAQVAMDIPVQVQLGNGVLSTPKNFVLQAGPPTIVSLNPSTIAIGAPDFVLRVIGIGFIPTSTININNIAAPTTLVSPTEVSIPVDTALLTVPTTVQITVKNGAVVSNSKPFTVTV